MFIFLMGTKTTFLILRLTVFSFKLERSVPLLEGDYLETPQPMPPYCRFMKDYKLRNYLLSTSCTTPVTGWTFSFWSTFFGIFAKSTFDTIHSWNYWIIAYTNPSRSFKTCVVAPSSRTIFIVPTFSLINACSLGFY